MNNVRRNFNNIEPRITSNVKTASATSIEYGFSCLKHSRTLALCLALFSFTLSKSYADQSTDVNLEQLLGMSLAELQSVKIKGVTLTDTGKRKVPSAITSISKQRIEQSGARSLNELLEMLVPNLQAISHPAKARHLGLRGINGTRDDKYLLVVDGRVMNEHTDVGVMSERDFPLLGDIQKIDVIRGTGSALYGPGALAMVISITTETAETFQGVTASQRIGAIEEFYSTEAKLGHIFDNGGKLFVYGGIALYPGADAEYSPIYYGATTDKNGISYGADEPVNEGIKNYNAAYGNEAKLKFHLNYQYQNMEAGLRYTKGGEYIDLARSDEINTLFGQGYQQANVFWRYHQAINDDFKLTYDAHYDRIDVVSEPESSGRYNNYREDKYFGKIIGNWRVNHSQQLALGLAWSHEKYGLSPGSNNDPVKMYRMTGEMPRWSTDMQSILGEYQWNISDAWTTFVSARLDKHTFTDLMFSPRATLIYTPNASDTFKLIASRAVRTNTGADMKNEYILGRSKSDVEILEAMEFRYEHQYSPALWLASSVFVHSQDLIGWGRTATNGDGQPMLLGRIGSWGAEFEANYSQDKLEVVLSHSYTKMLDFDITTGVLSVEETAEPMGYGNDFANWFDHISKVNANYQLAEKWRLNSTLVAYWYNPGGEDYALWSRSENNAAYELEQNKAFEPSYFLSLGVHYQYDERLTVRFDSYNVLGLLDEDFNTSRYGYNNQNSRPAMYRVRPESFSIKMNYVF